MKAGPGEVRYRKSVITGALAIAVALVGNAIGDVHSPHHLVRATAYVAAAVFLVVAIIALRSITHVITTLTSKHIGQNVGAPLHLVISVLGIIIIGFIDLGMLGVTAQKLLLGGAITGVIVGIAAQQSLGNVFSGLVLMFAHPFRVGDFVRVRSGALGGVIEGKILNLGLTYVKIEIDGLPVNIPNSTLLAAAVGPADKQS